MTESRADRRRNDTRTRLVRAATGLFRRHGIGSVGVGEICARAGVSKGVFTHHFPSGKSELVAAVAAANGAAVAELLARTMERPRAFQRCVRLMFDGYAQAMRNAGPDYGCPIATTVVDASARFPSARGAADHAFTTWRTVIASRSDEATATLVLAALEGAVILARAARDPTVIETAGRRLASLLDGAGDVRRVP